MGTYSATHGIVTRINGNGFELEGQGWLNLSKFARPIPLMPKVGDNIRCLLDGSGFVRKITQLAPETVEESEPEKPAPLAPMQPVNHVEAKDLRITRLAVLNTATAILSSGNKAATAKAVVELAAKLEAWVLR